MTSTTLRLRHLASVADIDVNAFCEACGQPLGRYSAGLRHPARDIVVLSEPGTVTRTDDTWMIKNRRPGLGVRGLKTQPRLELEEFGGRIYLRKKCSCPANEKRPLESLGDLPLNIRPDKSIVILF